MARRLFILCLTAVLLIPGNVQAEKRKTKLFEISVFGSYLASMGTPKLTSVAPDVYTGSWSPWFGQGYEDFHWTGLNPPLPLDDVIGAAVVNPENGWSSGFRLGVNVQAHWQIEFTFTYASYGVRFDDNAWAAVRSVIPDSTALLRAYGVEVTSKDESARSAGVTEIAGLSIHYNILDEGPVIPYVFAGVRYVDLGENKLIGYDLSQKETTWNTRARYFLDVYYKHKPLVHPSFGAGAKVFLGENLGLKLEATAIYAPLVLEQRVIATYYEDYWWWMDFTDCDRVFATQRANRFMIIGGLGLFATF